MTELFSEHWVDLIGHGLTVATIALLALALIVANRTLNRSVKPQVECYLHTPDRTPIRFDFVIANFGTGSAYNVGFTVHADDEDFEAHHVIMRGRGTTDTPFSIIEPGGRITSVFGSGPELLGGDNTALKPFKVTVTYEWQPFWSRRRRGETREFDLDVRPHWWRMSQVTKNEIAEVLKKELPRIARAERV